MDHNHRGSGHSRKSHQARQQRSSADMVGLQTMTANLEVHNNHVQTLDSKVDIMTEMLATLSSKVDLNSAKLEATNAKLNQVETTLSMINATTRLNSTKLDFALDKLAEINSNTGPSESSGSPRHAMSSKKFKSKFSKENGEIKRALKEPRPAAVSHDLLSFDTEPTTCPTWIDRDSDNPEYQFARHLVLAETRKAQGRAQNYDVVCCRAYHQGGNAIADIDTYSGQDDEDGFFMFEDLYGLSPPEVLRIADHKPTLDTLNTHASILVSRRKTATMNFYGIFQTFIKMFRATDLDVSYLNGNDTQVTDAYRAFWESTKLHVRSLP